MYKHFTVFFTAFCAFAVFSSGCASKWSLITESPPEPRQWLDDSKTTRVRHLASVKGFKETGTSAPNFLKYIVFGRSSDNIIVRPVAVAKGPDDRLAIADLGCKCVHLYVPSEQRYRKIYSAHEEELQSPVSVAFDDQAKLYVSDSLMGVIFVFDREGEHLFTIRNAGYTPLRRPTGLSYSTSKKILYAVDTLANKIYAYTNEGSLLFSFGERGEKHEQLNLPTHITTSPDGRIYVTDAMNFRVQVFDASGTFLSSFGHHGNGSGDFAMPKGVAVDKAGVIYVIDALFDNIQLFNLTGRFLFTIGSQGSGPGEFWLPSGIFIDNHDGLYVCDTYNQRVQIFQLMRNTK